MFIPTLKVVCRQLGYARATRAPLNAEFSEGTGVIWLDDVNCTGLESLLDLCPSSGWGDNYCDHYQDAGAVCEGELCQETKNIHTHTQQLVCTLQSVNSPLPHHSVHTHIIMNVIFNAHPRALTAAGGKHSFSDKEPKKVEIIDAVIKFIEL